MKTEKAGSKSWMAKVLTAICIVTLITIVLTGVFFKGRRSSNEPTGTDKIPGAAANEAAAEESERTAVLEETTQERPSRDVEPVEEFVEPVEEYVEPVEEFVEPVEEFVEPMEEFVEAVPLPKTGSVVTNSIGVKLVYIPAGSFMMGGSSSAAQLAEDYNIRTKELLADEFPQHQVRISKGFWMGQTEVTQGQYKSVMNAQPWSGEDYVQDDANNPAVYVSWDDAVEFCRKLSQLEGKKYRLPTEAEREYACRTGTTTRFSLSDSDSSLGDHAWFSDNAYEEGQGYAHSVGQKEPNPWGLYDMHGNVWEWCSDYYDEEYYSNSPSVDPKGPPSGDARCLRGGSWLSAVGSLRCSYRGSDDPGDRNGLVGFRVVLSQS